MPARTYRFGYGTTRLTLAELETRWTWADVHPELRRRLVRMFDHHPTGDLGCGSGSRDPISQDIEFRRRHFVSDVGTIYYAGQTWRRHSWAAPFAPPGGSNHEDDILDGYALAVDVVGWEDHWFDRNCHLYGLKNFGGAVGPNVNGEEWHAQPAETANSRRDVNTQVATGLRLERIPLPGDPTHTQTPTAPEGFPNMIRYIATPPANAGQNPPWLLRYDGVWSYLTSEDWRQATAAGLPSSELNLEQYTWAKQSAGLA